MKKTGIIMIWLFGLFQLMQTRHFGWNWVAESPAESICDGIGVIGVVVGIVLMKLKRTVIVEFPELIMDKHLIRIKSELKEVYPEDNLIIIDGGGRIK